MADGHHCGFGCVRIVGVAAVSTACLRDFSVAFCLDFFEAGYFLQDVLKFVECNDKSQEYMHTTVIVRFSSFLRFVP